MHESVQEVLCLALLQLFGGQGVSAVQNVCGGRFAILRAHDQVDLIQNSTHFLMSKNKNTADSCPIVKDMHFRPET